MKTPSEIKLNNLFGTKKHLEMISGGKSDHLRKEKVLPEILFITTFPPRECGIATYSQDLILAINNKFTNSFSIKIAALEDRKSTRLNSSHWE